MKLKNTITERKFLSLSDEQQTQELKKLTKRANVRLSLLEEKDTINLAYRQAYQFNINEDREKNRFSEKSRYKDKEEKLKTFEAVSSFLKHQSSTLKGVEIDVKTKIKDMTKQGQIDTTVIKKMSKQEQKYAVKYISELSNKKLEKLEKAKITQYAYGMADYYNNPSNDKSKKNRFDNKAKKGAEIGIQLDNMIHFYNAPTSTKKGYNDTIKKRLNAFEEKGVLVPKRREKEFFDFLSAEEFTKMGERASSDQVIETFNEARDSGLSAKAIMKKFHEYLDTNMTIDQLQEKLGVAKWRNNNKPKFYGRK